MPAKPRSEIFDPLEVGVYHCWNRLVRRRFLFGLDRLTGKEFGYRKTWVRERLKQLAGAMAIDVLDYAILDNHLHVVLRNRPDIVASWSDHEVAQRWWQVCPARRNPDGSAADPLPAELRMLSVNAEEYRGRLSDISWMMRLLCQPIARRANQEDQVDGRFFAKRFDCNRLETEADVLACSIYVDLNAVHAGIVDTPEKSEFTSAFDRIRARWQSVGSELGDPAMISCSSSGWDEWLAPLQLDEKAEDYTSAQVSCNSIRSARISNKGFLPMTIEQYLSLLDTIGRMVRSGKRGRIPPSLPPILKRLTADVDSWLDRLLQRFAQPSLQSAVANT